MTFPPKAGKEKMNRVFLSMAALVLAGSFAFAGPVQGQSAADRLSVHGFLTQGYASSTDIPIYGISTDGTTDYRAVALQFRYTMFSNDAMVFQFSHRRLGNSAIQEMEPDVALDWVFYQKKWAGNNIRVGKVPMPRGLFNEVRDVGTLFPFFRASKAFYSEGVETIDGISVGRSFDLGDTGFSIEGAVYGGEYDVAVELVTQDGLEVLDQELFKAYGIHGQVNTPVSGLRVVADYLTSEYDTGAPFILWTSGIDLTRDRFFARAEYEMAEASGIDNETGKEYDDTSYKAWYAQGGIGITPQLWANFQYEYNELTVHRALPSPPFPSPAISYDNIKDLALGISYRFSPFFVVKGEYHMFEGYQLEGGFPINPMTGESLPPKETDYFILSVATAF
jgi:hypothetical protein